MRDALSVLDQCVSFFSGEEITAEKVREITGSVDEKVFYEFARALFFRDSLTALRLIADFTEAGRDVPQFISEFIKILRDILVDKINNKTEFQNFDRSELIKYITAFSELSSKIKYEAHPRISLEVLCVKLCALGSSEIIDLPPKPAAKIAEAPIPAAEISKAQKQDFNDFTQRYNEFLKTLPDNLSSYLLSAKPTISGDSLCLEVTSVYHKIHLEKNTPQITEKARNFFDREFAIKIVLKSERIPTEDNDAKARADFFKNADFD
jgi:DNA polymerase III gamma/tau subunit